MLKRLIVGICIILWSSTTIKSQKYNRLFKYDLPQEKQILTLDKYVNSTLIQINNSPQHLTHLESQPYPQIKDLVAVNITYSLSNGFQSQWSQEKQNQEAYHILINNTQRLIEQEAKNPVICKTTSPQVFFRNGSSFWLQNMKKLPSSKIITNYQELLHEQDVILDVWKAPSEQNSSNLTFILISNGQLVGIQSFRNTNGTIEHKKESHKIANQLINAEFNTHRYFKQRKIYIFSQEVQIQIKMQIQPNKYTLSKMNISLKYPNKAIVDFQWVQVGNFKPYLAILTTTKMNIYSLSEVNQTYIQVQVGQLGLKEIASFLNAPAGFMINQDGTQRLMFKTAFFIQQEKSFILWQKSLGIIAAKFNLDNTLTVFTVSSAINAFDQIQRVNTDKNGQLTNINFMINYKNHLERLQAEIKNNRLILTHHRFDQFPVPAGQIIVESTEDVDLVFVVGQTKIMGMRSWKYPKIMTIENPYVDNLFVFGREYVAVVDNQVTIGSFDLVREKIVCTSNPNYKKLNLTSPNSTDKTADSTQSTNGNKTSSTKNVKQEQTTQNQTLSLLIQYIAECNFEVLLSFPYSFKEQQVGQKKYCRYKNVYPNVYLVQNKVQSSKKSSQKMQVILFITFAFSAILLIVGVGIWLVQKRKINAFLEEQGMPVGSEDLQTNTNGQHNLNLKLN